MNRTLRCELDFLSSILDAVCFRDTSEGIFQSSLPSSQSVSQQHVWSGVLTAALSWWLSSEPPFQPLCSSWTLVLWWTWVSLWVNERPGAAEQWVLVTLRATGSFPSAHGASRPSAGISPLFTAVRWSLICCCSVDQGWRAIYFLRLTNKPAAGGYRAAWCL